MYVLLLYIDPVSYANYEPVTGTSGTWYHVPVPGIKKKFVQSYGHRVITLSTAALRFLQGAERAALQHHHRISRRLNYVRAPVFPLCNLRHPRDLKSTTSREGEPFVDLYSIVYTTDCGRVYRKTACCCWQSHGCHLAPPTGSDLAGSGCCGLESLGLQAHSITYICNRYMKNWGEDTFLLTFSCEGTDIFFSAPTLSRAQVMFPAIPRP